MRRQGTFLIRETAVYTQPAGSNPLVKHTCGTQSTLQFDFDPVDPGQAAFYLTTGISGGESGLGEDSAGLARPNDNPCP